MNKIQQIEEVVRKECWWLEEYEDQNGKLEVNEYPIQLSDILYVMRKENLLFDVWGDGCFSIGNDIMGRCIYNLILPFKDQSEETINFLHKIICKEK